MLFALRPYPAVFRRYVEAEKTNARWAMLAVAGILFTEATGLASKWFTVGADEIGDYPLPALLSVQAVVMGFIETKRLQGFKETGKVPFLSFGWAAFVFSDARDATALNCCSIPPVWFPQRLPIRSCWHELQHHGP